MISVQDILILIKAQMNIFSNGFINRAFRIRVQGLIDQKMANTIARGLQNSWPYRPTSLLVTVNSTGGSVIQAKNIADQLKLYSNRFNIPIITFAEDQCLNSANIILTSGARCYASPFSMIGDIGFVWSTLWFNRFAKTYDIKKELIFSPENKIKLNPLEEIRPQSEKWAKNYVYGLEHELKVVITNNRAQHFTKKTMTKQSIEKELFARGVIDPQHALTFGLIDGLRSFDDEIKQKYSNIAIKQINKPPKKWWQSLSYKHQAFV